MDQKHLRRQDTAVGYDSHSHFPTLTPGASLTLRWTGTTSWRRLLRLPPRIACPAEARGRPRRRRADKDKDEALNTNRTKKGRSVVHGTVNNNEHEPFNTLIRRILCPLADSILHSVCLLAAYEPAQTPCHSPSRRRSRQDTACSPRGRSRQAPPPPPRTGSSPPDPPPRAAAASPTPPGVGRSTGPRRFSRATSRPNIWDGWMDG